MVNLELTAVDSLQHVELTWEDALGEAGPQHDAVVLLIHGGTEIWNLDLYLYSPVQEI